MIIEKNKKLGFGRGVKRKKYEKIN